MPWSWPQHGRAALKQPKAYSFDAGLLQGDEGVVFENLVAGHLLIAAHWQTDAESTLTELHYIRTKDDAEVNFCIAYHGRPEPVVTHLVEGKLSNANPHRSLRRFASELASRDPSLQACSDCGTRPTTKDLTSSKRAAPHLGWPRWRAKPSGRAEAYGANHLIAQLAFTHWENLPSALKHFQRARSSDLCRSSCGGVRCS